MQNNPKREDLITEIAEVINNIKLPHPVRVAIDGGGNAGKTTFADELNSKLNLLGRNTIRSTIDGFHNPPEIRRQQGFFTVASTCPKCQGSGQTIKDPCGTCNGEGGRCDCYS